MPGFSSCSEEEMKNYRDILSRTIPVVEIRGMDLICKDAQFSTQILIKQYQYPPFPPGMWIFGLSLKIWKAKHVCHKAFLLAVTAGYSQYVLTPVISAQQKMAEILISVHDKTVATETAVFSA